MSLSKNLAVPFAALSVLTTFCLAMAQPSDQTKSDDSLKRISAYKSWTKILDKPAIIPDFLLMRCIPPTEAELKLDRTSPHHNKYIQVYVNAIGKDAFLHQNYPKYPVGTIVVKERLASPESKTPELVTAMIKRSAGYDTKDGDWEYLGTSDSGKRVQLSGRLDACKACHVKYAAFGYVTRDYLTPEQEKRLK